MVGLGHVRAKKELKVLKAHCRLGDYAGKVYNDLKEHTIDQPLPEHSTDLSIIFKQVAQMGRKAEKLTRRATARSTGK
jgi:hypothetical protein